MTYRQVFLCKEGWKLYQEWVDLYESEDVVDYDELNIAQYMYLQHRSNCPQCTKILDGAWTPE